MIQEQTEDTSFLEGFNEFWRSEFPKTCPTCGRVYGDFCSFVRETETTRGSSGLVEYQGRENQETSVGIFRNCPCGSTLMIRGQDRRNTSEAGEKSRQIFGAMLEKLVAANVPRPTARVRLLKALYSGQLENLASRLLQ